MLILVRRRYKKERMDSSVKDIQHEIVIEIAVLSKSDSGYTKEVNLVSWNGAKPKYDIRSWSPDREKCGKGITLTADEAKSLLLALQNEFLNLE
jgi:hypothetical protein